MEDKEENITNDGDLANIMQQQEDDEDHKLIEK